MKVQKNLTKGPKMKEKTNSVSKNLRQKAKLRFKKDLKEFVTSLNKYVQTENGEWTVKGFIDIYKNIYTISADTKIVSKILEIHLFPKILEFAGLKNFKIQLAEHQNWYPDLTFIDKNNEGIKFAVDLKTTYRDFNYPNHVNGFTLGSHGAYFRNRKSTKNIQYPYSEYSGHFCLGIIYTRCDSKDLDETEIFEVSELKEQNSSPEKIGARKVAKVENLKSIASVIKNFDFFVSEKWELASDKQGSGNTANIGSITYIPDIKKGNGMFVKLGENWFDEYWMNYKVTKMLKDGKSKPITSLKDFLVFKGGDTKLINRKVTKRKGKK